MQGDINNAVLLWAWVKRRQRVAQRRAMWERIRFLAISLGFAGLAGFMAYNGLWIGLGCLVALMVNFMDGYMRGYLNERRKQHAFKAENTGA